MEPAEVVSAISQGRTDYVFELLKLPDSLDLLTSGRVETIRWFVYYNDVTALRAIVQQLGELPFRDINEELSSAAFFGHWKMCDFLITEGANVNAKNLDTNETPLHSAFCKAQRPYFRYVAKVLLENGADPNVATLPGVETAAFMRDVKTRGETPLHRAAAYGDLESIELLKEHGAKLDVRDANGDSPLTWASFHLRPAAILRALTFGDFRISEKQVETSTSDHGNGWGNGMDWKLIGEYFPESVPR